MVPEINRKDKIQPSGKKMRQNMILFAEAVYSDLKLNMADLQKQQRAR